MAFTLLMYGDPDRVVPLDHTLNGAVDVVQSHDR